MAHEGGEKPHILMPGPREVDRAIRYTYAQVMLNSIFFASTGGMFLVGFAMRLGADDLMLGLMTTLPALFVVFQFLGAWMVESGVSRRKLTWRVGLLTPAAWFLIAAIPFIDTDYARRALPFLSGVDVSRVQFAILVAVLALAALSMQVSGAARGSWLGELIPEKRRGVFFGHAAMFGGIMAALFAIGEGRFLDFLEDGGLFAFTGLFFFGSVFGLVSVLLNIPQPDCPLPREATRPSMKEVARRTMRNRPFLSLALTHALWSMTAISAPFGPAYMLRDVGVSFFGLGMLNAVWMLAWLATSSLWGRLVNRVGCRPVATLGFAMWAPCSLVWLAIPPGAAHRAYLILPWTHLIAGMGGAAASVAISTLIYKTSQPVGRSVQLAMYNTGVVLAGAPMPLLGGWLVSRLAGAGMAVDLRVTFFLTMALIVLCAVTASRIREEGAMSLRSLAFAYIPGRLARMGLDISQLPGYPSVMKRLAALLPVEPLEAPSLPSAASDDRDAQTGEGSPPAA